MWADNKRAWLIVTTTIITALSGGVFFAWTCSVMPGMKQLEDANFILSFQAMNRAIQNPLFFSCFFGAAILLLLSAWYYYRTKLSGFVLIAAFCYIIGVIGITIYGNIPLNENIDDVTISMMFEADLHNFRTKVETSWNRFNNIRSMASVISVTMLVIACVKHRRGD